MAKKLNNRLQSWTVLTLEEHETCTFRTQVLLASDTYHAGRAWRGCFRGANPRGDRDLGVFQITKQVFRSSSLEQYGQSRGNRPGLGDRPRPA